MLTPRRGPCITPPLGFGYGLLGGIRPLLVSFKPGVHVYSVPARVKVSCGGSLAALIALLGMSSEAAAQTPVASAAPPAPTTALGEPAAPAPVLSTPPTSVQDQGEAEDGPKQPRMFGAMFDIGVPDGTNLSFVYRPIDIARLHAGLGYNGVSPGLRIGGEYLPLGWGPSIGLAYGHFFEGDANGLAGMFGKPSEEASQVLDSVGYSFFALRAGMEFGGDRFTFFGRGGVTWISSTIHDLDQVMQPEAGSNTTVSIDQDPTLKAFVPTLQFGMIVQI